MLRFTIRRHYRAVEYEPFHPVICNVGVGQNESAGGAIGSVAATGAYLAVGDK